MSIMIPSNSIQIQQAVKFSQPSANTNHEMTATPAETQFVAWGQVVTPRYSQHPPGFNAIKHETYDHHGRLLKKALTMHGGIGEKKSHIDIIV